MSFQQTSFPLLFLLGLWLLGGCAPIRGPSSLYANHYEKHLKGLSIPSREEIREADGDGAVFPHSVDKVWEVCLDVAIQHRGILGVENDLDGGHRLLVVSGARVDYQRKGAQFIDRWLAVSVEPSIDGSSRVFVALVSPETSRAIPLISDPLPPGLRGDRQRSIAQAAGSAFVQQLREQLRGTEYLERIDWHRARHSLDGRVSGALGNEGHNSPVAQKLGNLRSAALRRWYVVLELPEVQERLSETVTQLALAAGQTDLPAQIYILADDKTGAEVTSNGDLFVSTGLLEEAESVDELAGVLAHELAHLYLGHAITRNQSVLGLRRSRVALASVFMIGGVLASGLIDTSSPESAAPEDTLLTLEDVLVGAAVGAGALFISSEGGEVIGTEIADIAGRRFTKHQELEADDYAVELLGAAGYDYRGLLRLLERRGTFERLVEDQ